MIRLQHHQRAFTLIEILVAVLIFGLLGLAAQIALSSAQQTQVSLKARGERFNELTRAINLLARDYRQLAVRRVRDENGDRLPIVRANDDGNEVMLEFTRSGWRNPAQLPRSTLEHVVYRLENEKLWRYSYLLLDQTTQLKPEKQMLLSGIKQMELRVMPPNAQLLDTVEWKREWPIGGKLNSDDADKSPRAIKVMFDIDGIGEVHRVLP